MALAFCDDGCVKNYQAAAPAAAERAHGEERCAACSETLRREPPPWTAESRALLAELCRLTRGRGPVLERALRFLDRDSVHALRLAVRDLEWEKTSLQNKAARLGLRGVV